MSESQNIEWKRSWRDEYLKWICGFANATGGKIFIGKDDEGNLVEVKNIQKLLEEIPNKARNLLGVIIDVNLHSKRNIEYLEIIIESYPFPVNYKGKYYYRSGSTNQELTGSALDKFMLRKKGKKWDAVPIPNVSIDQLDDKAFNFFRKLALKSGRVQEGILNDTNEHIIYSLQLNENQFLKRAAILLFHNKPETFVTGSYVKIGYFKSDSELIFQDEIHGNLFVQAEKTIEILFTKYIKANISYKGIQRIETFDFPKEAIREAILNAISHKDYSSGAPIQISVYKDKIMIWNNGELPVDWTIDDLKSKHASIPYNPEIANAFFRIGYIESWGRGIKKIIEKCKEAGIPDVTFKYKPSDFWITFKKDIYFEDYLNQLNLNKRQVEALIHWKKEGVITNSQYKDKFAISDRTALRDLFELTERGILKKVGEKRTVKYLYNN